MHGRAFAIGQVLVSSDWSSILDLYLNFAKLGLGRSNNWMSPIVQLRISVIIPLSLDRTNVGCNSGFATRYAVRVEVLDGCRSYNFVRRMQYRYIQRFNALLPKVP